ncbi:MAG: branched-chain amino acid transaminase [Terriglobales bacterium]
MPATPPDPNTIVWFRGQFVRLADAHVNILTHGLNYGTGVFEGIRGYHDERDGNLYLMRAADHYRRWKQNCGILRLSVEQNVDELCELTAELCRRNQFHTNVYVRPFAYKASAAIGVHSDANDAYAIVVVPFGAYFARQGGLSAAVSSWKRVDDNAIPGRGKIAGAYANSVLAGDEAAANGFDEAIFLNQAGHVCEAAAANVFLVRHGQLITPSVSEDILEGITRESVIELARQELHLAVVERPVDRTELYIAEEMFLCGTGAEIKPVISVDHRPVGAGEPGPLTRKLSDIYREATRGHVPAYRHWLTPAYTPEAVRA